MTGQSNPGAAQPASNPPASGRAVMTIGATEVQHATKGYVLDLVARRAVGHPDRPLAIGSVNVDHLHHFAGGDAPRFGDTVDWLMLADGAPVALRGGLLVHARWPRLTGADLLPDILTTAATVGASVGFLGGTTEMHDALRTVLTDRWPALADAPMWCPTPDELADPTRCADMARAVADAGVDVLVVSLGKPRQEGWIDRYGADSGARVLLAFGASADFLAGRIARAPEAVQTVGAEWLYRLVLEPRRLARRYLVQGPRQLRVLAAAGLSERTVGRLP